MSKEDKTLTARPLRDITGLKVKTKVIHQCGLRNYLSWEVVVCLLRKVSIVWRQMRDNIISICYPYSVRHKFTIVSSKDCITNTRLSKCHNLNILLLLIDLGIQKPKEKRKMNLHYYVTDLKTCFQSKLKLIFNEVTWEHQEQQTTKH